MPSPAPGSPETHSLISTRFIQGPAVKGLDKAHILKSLKAITFTLMLSLLTCSVLAGASKPHVIAILADDYGWAGAGWHRPAGYKEIATPVMNQLVADGVELDRHYVFKVCSPTRSATQSGRNPIHGGCCWRLHSPFSHSPALAVNTVNIDPLNYNPMDNVSGYAAVPRNMTCLAQVMKKAGELPMQHLASACITVFLP
jgi:arylsulfatase I/J